MPPLPSSQDPRNTADAIESFLSLLKTIHQDRSSQYVTAFFVALILGWFFLLSPNQQGAAFQIHDAGQQPADSLAPINAVRLPFTNFTLSNNTDHDVVVSGINVITDNTEIQEVSLIDQLGFQVGSTENPDAQGRASVGDEFTLPAGSTMTYTVAGNISNCDTPCSQNKTKASVQVIGLSSPDTLGGALPIRGATHLINSDLKIGSVMATDLGANSPYSTFSNNKDVVFSNLRFKADGNEDLKMYSIRYRYTGTADRRLLNNLNVKIDGNTNPAVWSPDGTYVTASSPGGLDLKGGTSMDVSLRGDVAIDNSPGNTVEFDIETPSEAYFVGQIYGYGVPPKGSFSTGRPWFKGPTFNGTNKVTPSSLPSVI